MFNFHKPRVYRSTEGCCICRAKSSSSRFTDSRKYETESVQCFNLEHPRHGEICNACVLLVKRYKRLPVGNKRHWGHVVDARAGPGTKSLAKQKKREEWGESSSNSKSLIPEKFAKIFKKNRNGKTKNTNNSYKTSDESSSKSKLTDGCENQSDSNESDDESAEATCGMSNARQSQVSSPPLVVQFQTQTRASAQKQQLAAASARIASPVKLGSKRRRMLAPVKHRQSIAANESFFERSDLMKLDICCGVIYQYAPMPEFVVIDADEYRPCEKHLKLASTQTMSETTVQQPTQAQTQSGVDSPPLVRLAPVSIADGAFAIAPPGDGSIPLTKHTPALKKHHLFYKRQSESFPKVDLNPTSQQTTTPLPSTQTPSASNAATTPMVAKYVTGYMPRHSTNSIALQELSATATTVAAPSKKSTHNLALVLKPCAVAGVAAQQNVAQPITTSVGASSPSALSTSSSCSSTSSSSSSSATKFNDNSSDSGFDEHVQDRKSASPPSQDEHDKKPPTRNNGVQRLIIASGIQISGQTQNVLLAGNEFSARMLQQRQQRALKMAAVHKANVDGSGVDGVVNLGSHKCGNSSAGSVSVPTVSASSSKKLRAIYNTNNTIQHENGVTTILPASSLAASNQTAAMNAIAPSTVTITPSPCGVGVGVGVPKKISLSGHLQPLSLNTVSASSSSVSSNLSANSVAVNGSSQKIIFVKATTATATAAPTA